ncbi:MAG: hypothetical protein IPO28_13465 [Holophagaceae bacterium]|nr:hypothetical protein [Holophagaceae bacterium]
MFIAHQGKTTLREKLVGGRFIADLPGATPHLTHGYTTFSPIWITQKLQAAKATWTSTTPAKPAPVPDHGGDEEAYAFEAKGLWSGTVKPATDAENWFVSASAAYWQQLKGLPAAPAKAFEAQAATLADLNTRHLCLDARKAPRPPWPPPPPTTATAPTRSPASAASSPCTSCACTWATRPSPRPCARPMSASAESPPAPRTCSREPSEGAGRDVAPLLKPWLERADLPAPRMKVDVKKAEAGHAVTLTVDQPGFAYPFIASVSLETAKGARLERIQMSGATGTFTFQS